MATAAAIDVGSNAIRIGIGELGAGGKLRVTASKRESVRLGHDVFTTQRIGSETIERGVMAIKRLCQFASDRNVSILKIVGTSALREAANQAEFTAAVKAECGQELSVISGEEEAELIFLAVSNVLDLAGKAALLIDIGGGSVEVTLAKNGVIAASESAPMGAVRMLEIITDPAQGLKEFNSRIDRFAAEVQRMVSGALLKQQLDVCAGTGGNINILAELRAAQNDRPQARKIGLDELEKLNQLIQSMSFEERVSKLGLNRDRADIIVPASILLVRVLQAAGVEWLEIPGAGLKEGVILSLLR